MWYNIIWYGRTSGLQQHPQHLVQLDLRPLEVLRKKSGEREREREKERERERNREREREKERKRERERERERERWKLEVMVRRQRNKLNVRKLIEKKRKRQEARRSVLPWEAVSVFYEE